MSTWAQGLRAVLGRSHGSRPGGDAVRSVHEGVPAVAEQQREPPAHADEQRAGECIGAIEHSGRHLDAGGVLKVLQAGSLAIAVEHRAAQAHLLRRVLQRLQHTEGFIRLWQMVTSDQRVTKADGP